MGLKLIREVVFPDLGRGEYFITDSLELLVNRKGRKQTAVFTVGLHVIIVSPCLCKPPAQGQALSLLLNLTQLPPLWLMGIQ